MLIHTDFERGFIRADATLYAAGRMGIEGKDYVVQDGDIMHFLFTCK